MLLVLAVLAFPLYGQTNGEQLANEVYERLTRAAGVVSPPKLVVQRYTRSTSSRVAFLRTVPGPLPRREIVIDDKTIEICEGFGKQAGDCLAYFLGHELAHFANNHNWGSHFARHTVQEGVSPARSIEYETQADRFGGFYAALAGYDTLSVAGAALAAVYREYQIPANLPGYSSLADRAKVPEEAREFLSGLLPMFRMAGLLMALGHYEEAAALYDAVLEQFPSREIFNNAGVALARLYSPTTPWLLDGSTRLPVADGRRGPVREDLLARARERFEKAISLDRDYAVARLNLGLLLQLQGEEPERATAELKTAVRLAKGNQLIEDAAAGKEPSPSDVPVDESKPQLSRTELLPGGKRPADFVPAARQPIVNLAGGVTFFTRTVNGQRVMVVAGIGTDRRTVIAVEVAERPAEWEGKLGRGEPVALFPESGVLYEKVGVLVRGQQALVYQVR